MTKFFCSIAASLFCSFHFAPAGHAHQIDCAILLCLPGGFPASAECGRAKLEVMRRIMPLPEPPIQLWRCPMNTGAASPGTGANGITPYVRNYIAAIEVWELSKRSWNSSEGRSSEVTAVRNHYPTVNQFERVHVGRDYVPSWVNEALRGHTGRYDVSGDHGSFRGILFRYGDADGNMITDWIPY